MDLHLDCGEILPGHRFLITGIRYDHRQGDQHGADCTCLIEGSTAEPMVAVTYEVRPGLTQNESHLYVDPGIELRPRRPQTIAELQSKVVPGSVAEERDEAVGGPVTAGAFGPFICPEATEQIILRLQPYQVETYDLDGRRTNPGAPELLAGVCPVTGTATLDLVTRTARWDLDRGHQAF